MLKKIILLLGVLFGCVACMPHKTAMTNEDANCPRTQVFKFAHVDTVIVSDSAHVTMTQGANMLTLHGTPEDLATSSIKIDHNTLYIDVPATTAMALTVNLCITQLHNLTVVNHAYVTGDKLHFDDLTIKAENYGAINLEGQLGVNQVTQRGAGKIDLSWINSDKLVIDSNNNGPIYLAGAVKDMLAKLSKTAHLDARYLRTQKATVLTADTAEAYVLATKSLAAYAIEKSNIYYYKRPPKFTVVTRDAGNVLKPDWIQ